MTFIFYDTETTGLEPAFDQVLQFAAIVTDDNFKVMEEVNLRSRLQPHVVASPGAMRITRVGPTAVQQAPLSFYEMTRAIRSFITKWSPAIIIGFNSIDYDERMLRQAFYQTLHPVYLTNTNGNSRVDVLRLAHAVAEYRPEAISVPLNDKGNRSFRLVHLIEANGLALDQAHDALADTRATFVLARFLKERAPDIWDALYSCRSRQGVEALLKKEDVVLFTDRAFGKATIVAGLITRHPDNPSSLALFDLSYDPALYLDIDHDRALQLLKSNPRPIRIAKANALPILRPPYPGMDLGVGIAVAHERLERIRAHPTFAATIAKAMAGQYVDAEPGPYVEQRIYQGFPAPRDQRLMEAFHEAPWAERVELTAQFEDERFREIGERLIYIEYPQALTADRRAALDGWRRERMTAADGVPWLTLVRAQAELDKLRAEGLPEIAPLIIELEAYFDELARTIRAP